MLLLVEGGLLSWGRGATLRQSAWRHGRWKKSGFGSQPDSAAQRRCAALRQNGGDFTFTQCHRGMWHPFTSSVVGKKCIGVGSACGKTEGDFTPGLPSVRPPTGSYLLNLTIKYSPDGTVKNPFLTRFSLCHVWNWSVPSRDGARWMGHVKLR